MPENAVNALLVTTVSPTAAPIEAVALRLKRSPMHFSTVIVRSGNFQIAQVVEMTMSPQTAVPPSTLPASPDVRDECPIDVAVPLQRRNGGVSVERGNGDAGDHCYAADDAPWRRSGRECEGAITDGVRRRVGRTCERRGSGASGRRAPVTTRRATGGAYRDRNGNGLTRGDRRRKGCSGCGDTGGRRGTVSELIDGPPAALRFVSSAVYGLLLVPALSVQGRPVSV